LHHHHLVHANCLHVLTPGTFPKRPQRPVSLTPPQQDRDVGPNHVVRPWPFRFLISLVQSVGGLLGSDIVPIIGRVLQFIGEGAAVGLLFTP
jgi:hypothetical protein